MNTIQSVDFETVRQIATKRDLAAYVTNGVLLRDVTEADLPFFFEHQRDPEATQMAAFPARDKEPFMAHWKKILDDDSVITKTILLDGQLVGNIVSFPEEDKTAVGYWLGRHYWGKGIATRALSTFLGHVQTRPLYAYVAKHNIGSRRVLEKCGFALIGEGKVPGEEIEELILKLD